MVRKCDGNSMVITCSVVLLHLFMWLLSTVVWLSRDYEPMWLKKTLRLKGELFCPRSFGEEVAGLGFIPCLSDSRFCLLSAKPCCLSAKKKDVGVGTGRGFFSALPLSAEGLLKGNM